MNNTHELTASNGAEEKEILSLIDRYARTWTLLLQYDEDRLPLPGELCPPRQALTYDRSRQAIDIMKKVLITHREAGSLFGQERGHAFQGILGNIDQSFGGNDLYPSIEEKAAHLLYFIIKDHPFSDGNKRLGAFLFLLFLQENGLLEKANISNSALVTLALLIAESDPGQKDLMTRLIINLLNGQEEMRT